MTRLRPDPRPVALLVPGAGSTPDFLARTFTGPLHDHGFRLATLDLRGVDPGEELAALDDAVRACTPALLGGVSFGAHLAARWAVSGSGPVQALLAVMPAWTGAAGPVAGLTAASAARVAAHGSAGLLAELDRDVPIGSDARWIVDELGRAWPSWGDHALAAHLGRVADAPGPTLAGLRRLAVPLAAVALADDPLHPAEVASEWARTARRGALVEVPLGAPGDDVEALGAAAVQALRVLAPGTSRTP